MYAYICAECGKVVKVEYRCRVQKFCSKSCSAKHGNRMRGRNAETVSTNVITAGDCVFQPESIECFKRNCNKCGWNPVVAKARLDKFMGVDNHADQML